MKLMQFSIDNKQAKELAQLSRLSHISKAGLIRLALYPFLAERLKEFDNPPATAPPDDSPKLIPDLRFPGILR